MLPLLLSLSAHAGPAVSVSYFGEQLTHPGLKVGVEWSLVDGTSRRGMDRALLVQPSLAAWTHPDITNGVLVDGQLIYRKTRPRGFKREVLVGTGFVRTANASPTYTSDGQRVWADGRVRPMVSVGIGLGRDLSKRRDLPLAWQIRPLVFVHRDNTSLAPHLAVEAGVTWSF
jgi:hypothetical protein